MADEPIDFHSAKNKRDIDPQHIMKDDFGREMYEFVLFYEFNGSTWGGVTVWAYSRDEAEQRVASMRDSLVLLGQLGGIIQG